MSNENKYNKILTPWYQLILSIGGFEVMWHSKYTSFPCLIFRSLNEGPSLSCRAGGSKIYCVIVTNAFYNYMLNAKCYILAIRLSPFEYSQLIESKMLSSIEDDLIFGFSALQVIVLPLSALCGRNLITLLVVSMPSRMYSCEYRRRDYTK